MSSLVMGKNKKWKNGNLNIDFAHHYCRRHWWRHWWRHVVQEPPLYPTLSDHSVLNIRIRCDKNITAHTTTKYLYDKGDYNSIITEFGKIDWNSLFAGDNLRDDVAKQWQLFNVKYLELVDKYIPKRTFSKTAQNPGDTRGKYCKDVKSVSYTHLTLPTIYSV